MPLYDKSLSSTTQGERQNISPTQSISWGAMCISLVGLAPDFSIHHLANNRFDIFSVAKLKKKKIPRSKCHSTDQSSANVFWEWIGLLSKISHTKGEIYWYKFQTAKNSRRILFFSSKIFYEYLLKSGCFVMLVKCYVFSDKKLNDITNVCENYMFSDTDIWAFHINSVCWNPAESVSERRTVIPSTTYYVTAREQWTPSVRVWAWVLYSYCSYCLHIWSFGKGSFNTGSPRQDGRNFPDDIFKCIKIFLNENVRISINSSLSLFPRVQLTIFEHWFR